MIKRETTIVLSRNFKHDFKSGSMTIIIYGALFLMTISVMMYRSYQDAKENQ